MNFPRVRLFGSQTCQSHPARAKKKATDGGHAALLLFAFRYSHPVTAKHFYATPANTMTSVQDTGDGAVVFLQPRPFAKCSGKFVLLPLLPHKPRAKPLPSEVWTRVFGYLYDEYEVTAGCQNRAGLITSRESLLHICKNLTVRLSHPVARSRNYD